MEEQILKIINTVLQNRNKSLMEEISPDFYLRDDVGLDSLDLAELTVRIEAEFDIDIFEDGIVNTIGEIIEKLNRTS